MFETNDKEKILKPQRTKVTLNVKQNIFTPQIYVLEANIKNIWESTTLYTISDVQKVPNSKTALQKMSKEVNPAEGKLFHTKTCG